MLKFKERKHNSFVVVWVNNVGDGLRGHWLAWQPCHVPHMNLKDILCTNQEKA